MSVTVAGPAGTNRRNPVRGALGDAITLARTQSLENRRCTRRVRQEAWDAVAVALFSAAASTALALAITLVVAWAG